MEASQSAPVIGAMVKRSIKAGISTSNVLKDTWFTRDPLVKALVDLEMDVIGMVEAENQHYALNGILFSLKKCYSKTSIVTTTCKSKFKKMIKNQLLHWVAGPPSYIKDYLSVSLCEF